MENNIINIKYDFVCENIQLYLFIEEISITFSLVDFCKKKSGKVPKFNKEQ